MISKFMKFRFLPPLALSVFALGLVPVSAEDIEIYLDPDPADAGMPIVMLSIDLRSNMGSTTCGGDEYTPSENCKQVVVGYNADGTPNGETCATGSFDHLGNDDGLIMRDTNGDPILDGGGNPIPLSDAEKLERLWDNTKGKQVCGNPNQLYHLLKAAIRYVFYDFTGIKVGVMVNHNNITAQQGTGNNKFKCPNKADEEDCSDGGFILKKATVLNNIGDFNSIYNKLSSLNSYKDISFSNHSYQGVELFFELFRYLSGEAIWNAHVDNEDDSPQVPYSSWDPAAEGPSDAGTPDDASDDISNNTYISPVDNQCSKVYTINFLHGVSEDDGNSDAEINSSTGGLSNILTGNLAWPDSGIPGYTGQMGDFERILLALKDIDFGDGQYPSIGTDYLDENWEIDVTSYFFEVANNDPSRTVEKYAAAGGGAAYPVGDDPGQLIKDLQSVLNNILSTSTTFVSASVPVNVFNRSQFLSNVYLAIFEAEESGKPRWVGNLKRLTLNDTVTRIVDKNGNPAFLNNGKLAPTALTFWTDSNGFDIANYTLDLSIGGNLSTDGQYIDRGGAGQQIPGYLAEADVPGTSNGSGYRMLYTDGNNGAALSATPLNATAALAETYWNSINAKGWATYDDGVDADAVADFANASNDDKTIALNILNYARGYDVNLNGLTLSGVKRWMLGDPVHSKPVPINYGAHGSYTEANPDIRIVMGSNDGIFRMIENNLSNGTESGKELWGFMPQEMLSIQRDLMRNQPTTPLHPYGIDGAPIIYAEDKYREVDGSTVLGGDGTLDSTHCINSDCDKVYAFFGLRRGGKTLYALDISNPDDPKFMWKINKTSGGDFDELGYSFSNPRVISINYANNTDVLALVFAGGYDLGKDEKNIIAGGAIDNNGARIDDTEGRAVYIVNAQTGALIWKAAYAGSDGYDAGDKAFYHSGLLDSIPSDVTVLDTSGNNNVDRMYVGDTGGNIWRIDLYGTDISKWGMYKFASLGRHVAGNDNKANDRRFFHRPDFVKSRDAKGLAFDAVIIGSGDRANPKDKFTSTTDIPQNHLYMLKDKNIRSEEFDYNDRGICNNKDFSNDGRPCKPDPIILSNLSDLTSNCIQDADVSCTGIANLVTDHTLDERYYFTENGWYIRLVDFAISEGTETYQGEKNLSSPLTLGASIFFTTYLPDVEFDIAAALNVAQNLVNTATTNLDNKQDELDAAIVIRDDALAAVPLVQNDIDTAQGVVDTLEAERDILDDDLLAAGEALSDLQLSGGPSSCGPSEGSGLAYVVNMHSAGATINLNTTKSTEGNIEPTKTKEDRVQHLGSGIPSDVVPLGDGKVLLPGGIIVQVPSAGTWRTFWYENLK